MKDDTEQATETEFKPSPEVRSDGVPICHDDCPQYDGKRCRIMGLRAPLGHCCEPAVVELVATVRPRDEAKDRLASVEARRAAKNLLESLGTLVIGGHSSIPSSSPAAQVPDQLTTAIDQTSTALSGPMTLTPDAYAAWLASLQPGHDVAYKAHERGVGVDNRWPWHKTTVVKRTPTGRINTSDDLVFASDGLIIGGASFTGAVRLEPVTTEVLEALNRQDVERTIMQLTSKLDRTIGGILGRGVLAMADLTQVLEHLRATIDLANGINNG